MRRLSIVAFVLIASAPGAYAQIAPAPGASASPTAASSASSESALKPGTIINAGNVDQFGSLVPPAAKFAVQHGFGMRLIPQRRIAWSHGFQLATEKYSPQVTLDAHDYIRNYVAGMPFPLINVTDPKAAVKIAYNWHLGPVMPDDFSLAPWSSNGYGIDRQNGQRIVPMPDAEYACEEFDFLRFTHRTEVEPRPTLAEGGRVEWKAKCTQWTADATGHGTNEGAGIWIRYVDPTTPDEFMAFNEATRRLRRMGGFSAYPSDFCRGCHQPYWAYALPKTESYTYRLLGTTTILACMAADDEPAGIKQAEKSYSLTEEPFELRNAYVLEMTPSDPTTGLRTLIYIDSEIYLWLAAEFFESGGQTAVAIPLWRMRPSPEGGNLFDLAGSFYVPSGGTFFRSLVPAHDTFKQTINAGTLGEAGFMSMSIMR